MSPERNTERNAPPADDPETDSCALPPPFEYIRLQHALDSSGTGIVEINLVEGNAFFSSHAKKILGFDSDPGSRWYSYITKRVDPEDVARLDEEFKAATSVPYGKIRTTFRYHSTPEKTAWISFRGRIVSHTPVGSPERFMGLISDITEQKNLEEDLLSSRSLFQHLVEAIPDFIFIINRDDTIGYMNPTLLNLHGKILAQVAGRPRSDFFSGETGERQKAHLENVFTTGSVVSVEEHYVLGSHDFWKSGTLSPLRDSSGNIIGALGIMKDTTARKKMDEDIGHMMTQISFFNRILRDSLTSKSYRQFFTAFTTQLKPIISFDRIVIYRRVDDTMNARVLFQQGVPENVLEQIRTITIQSPPMETLFFQGASEFIEDVSQHASFLHCGDIQFIARIPIKDETGVIGSLHLVGHDPHSFSDWEREFLESLGTQVGFIIKTLQFRKELVESNSRANLYLDILTHDISNAILAPTIHAELLSETLTGDEREILEKIRISLTKASDILKDVDTIRLIHQTQPVLSNVSLDTVIRDEIHLNPEISIAYTGTDLKVSADALLKEIFTNLIGNSVKYAGRDAKIEIQVEDLGCDAGIRISDNGPGVADEKKPLLFRWRSRATEKKSGKGLGLYIVASLISRYGGSIRAEDRVPGRPGEGFAVYFTLRKYREPPVATNPECNTG